MITDLKQVAKYLGYGSKVPEEKTMADMIAIANELERSVKAAWTYGNYILEQDETGPVMLAGTAVELNGKSIKRTLKDCKEVYIMACTLGVQGDRLIEMKKMLSPTQGMIADACASVLVEAYADHCQEEIEAKLPETSTLTFRYAPGYGDLPLAANKEILELLKAEKRIGIHLTDSMLMTPRKSIVAILGVLEDKKRKGKNHRCGKQSCDACELSDDCPARK